MVEWSLLIGGVGIVLSYLSYQAGVRKHSSEAGLSRGSIETDIKYIREMLTEIKDTQTTTHRDLDLLRQQSLENAKDVKSLWISMDKLEKRVDKIYFEEGK